VIQEPSMINSIESGAEDKKEKRSCSSPISNTKVIKEPKESSFGRNVFPVGRLPIGQ
jgi:hypothetical protein